MICLKVYTDAKVKDPKTPIKAGEIKERYYGQMRGLSKMSPYLILQKCYSGSSLLLLLKSLYVCTFHVACVPHCLKSLETHTSSSCVGGFNWILNCECLNWEDGLTIWCVSNSYCFPYKAWVTTSNIINQEFNPCFS